MPSIKQSDPRAVERRVYFTCVDATALQTRLQASDMSTFTVKISKNGTSTGSIGGSAPVEVNATDKKGEFYVELAVADIDTVGKITLKITNTGGTKTMEPREIVVKIEPAFFVTAVTGTLASDMFTTDRTETADNFWKGVFLEALTGTLAGQAKKVAGYVGSSKTFVMDPTTVFTGAPANGDLFEIINR